jgi:ABC-type transporter Mla subunit MlaD
MKKRYMVFCFYGLLFLTIIFSCVRDKEYILYILFDNVEGLTTKSPVKSSGLVIGRVDNMQLYRGKVIVAVNINRDVAIQQGSFFKIKSADLIGTKYIDVRLSSFNSGPLRNNDTIEGQYDGGIQFFNDVASLKMDSAIMLILKPLLDSLGFEVKPGIDSNLMKK